jgi:hypothetical protein
VYLHNFEKTLGFVHDERYLSIAIDTSLQLLEKQVRSSLEKGIVDVSKKSIGKDINDRMYKFILFEEKIFQCDVLLQKIDKVKQFLESESKGCENINNELRKRSQYIFGRYDQVKKKLKTLKKISLIWKEILCQIIIIKMSIKKIR